MHPQSIKSPIRRRRRLLKQPPSSPSARLLSLPDTASLINLVIQEQLSTEALTLKQLSLSLSSSSSSPKSTPSTSTNTTTSSSYNDLLHASNVTQDHSRVVKGINYQEMTNNSRTFSECSPTCTTEDPLSEMRKRRCCMRTFSTGSQLLSIAQDNLASILKQNVELKERLAEQEEHINQNAELKERLAEQEEEHIKQNAELKERLAEQEEHIESLHSEYEHEIKMQLENQRTLLTRRARAVKLAALREKDLHMKAHLEKVRSHVTELAERSSREANLQ